MVVMKKLVALVVCLALVFSLSACIYKEGYGDGKMYFEARVIATEGTEMLVGGGEIGLCIVSFPEGTDLSEYERGDYVQIGHSGTIAESYPSQARGYAIRELSREEIKSFRREVTLVGVCQSITEEEIHIHAEDGNYMIRVSYLNEIPPLSVGDAVKVVYDGILDNGPGVSEICFPSSLTKE